MLLHYLKHLLFLPLSATPLIGDAGGDVNNRPSGLAVFRDNAALHRCISSHNTRCTHMQNPVQEASSYGAMFLIYETTGKSQHATPLCPKATLRTTISLHDKNTFKQHPPQDNSIQPRSCQCPPSRFRPVISTLLSSSSKWHSFTPKV